MVHAIVTFAIFVAVMAVTAVVFFIWLIFKIIGWAGRMMTGGKSYAAPIAMGECVCRNIRCRAMNPHAAHYCRRCGWSIQPDFVGARYVRVGDESNPRPLTV